MTKQECTENLHIGELPRGARNAITDVAGVTVGHATIDTERHKTGVTVVLPCRDNIFLNKMPCAAFVWNGFGKTQGLVQIQELGTLETPVALTNTLNIGLVHDAMVEYMLDACQTPEISIRSVNPVVCECNDGTLNDIRERAVTKEHVFSAIAQASADFAEGDVGCGKGMICHGLKGGVGSSSRVVEVCKKTYTVGVLVQTNHGRTADLTVMGENIGGEIARTLAQSAPDKGSCIMILATDLPVTDRQLGRIIRRMSVGLARLGSYVGHGSGEVMIGFTTANRVPHNQDKMISMQVMPEDELDTAFRAAAECTEEAVLMSMLQAGAVTGYTGVTKHSLSEFWTPGM